MNGLNLAPHPLADETAIGLALRHGAQLVETRVFGFETPVPIFSSNLNRSRNNDLKFIAEIRKITAVKG